MRVGGDLGWVGLGWVRLGLVGFGWVGGGWGGGSRIFWKMFKRKQLFFLLQNPSLSEWLTRPYLAN